MDHTWRNFGSWAEVQTPSPPPPVPDQTLALLSRHIAISLWWENPQRLSPPLTTLCPELSLLFSCHFPSTESLPGFPLSESLFSTLPGPTQRAPPSSVKVRNTLVMGTSQTLL